MLENLKHIYAAYIYAAKHCIRYYKINSNYVWIPHLILYHVFENAEHQINVQNKCTIDRSKPHIGFYISFWLKTHILITTRYFMSALHPERAIYTQICSTKRFLWQKPLRVGWVGIGWTVGCSLCQPLNWHNVETSFDL